MSRRVAVLGANGFIGSRVVELLHLLNLADVRPVVRDVSALARTSRFDLDNRIADGRDAAALKAALQGIDCLVHAIAGDRRTILGTLGPVYKASEAAGVRRIVYLSTASVHGQSPSAGTDESSALPTRHDLPYSAQKAQAERDLLALRKRGRVEVVILRPGIVTGPRSSWIAGFADELLGGVAYVVNGARGICNSVYIDNLVQAIYRAFDAPGADTHAFLIGDAELVTWADLYRPITQAFGLDIDQVPSVTFKPRGRSRLEQLTALRESMDRLWVPLPERMRRVIASSVKTWFFERSSRSPWSIADPFSPEPTLERALLHGCTYKLPSDKAARTLGYRPEISFAEGSRRSIEWLRFAGYPVVCASEQAPDV